MGLFDNLDGGAGYDPNDPALTAQMELLKRRQAAAVGIPNGTPQGPPAPSPLETPPSANGGVDVATGMIVPDTQLQPGMGNANWSAAKVIGHAVAPGLIPDNGPEAYVPQPPAQQATSPAPQPPPALSGDRSTANPDLFSMAMGQHAPHDPNAVKPGEAEQFARRQAMNARLGGGQSQATQAQTAPPPGYLTTPPAQPPGAPPQGPPAEQAPTGAPQTAPDQRDYRSMLPSIFSSESNNDPNAKNKSSSASGAGQFLDSTFNDFVTSDANVGSAANGGKPWTAADKNKTVAQQEAGTWLLSSNDKTITSKIGRPPNDDELKSSWLFGGAGTAALLANPGGNAYETLRSLSPDTVAKVFAGNAGVIKPDMTGAEAVAATANFYRTGKGLAGGAGGFEHPGSGTSGQPDGSGPMILSSTSEPAGSGPQQAQQGVPGIPQGLEMPYKNAAAPNSSMQILALASGLLSGPTFGKGLGEGLKNMVGVQQADRTAQMQMNSNALTQQYHSGLLGYKGADFNLRAAPKVVPGSYAMSKDEQGNPVMTVTMRDAQGNLTQVPMSGLTPAAQRTLITEAQGNKRIENSTDPNVAANRAGGAVTGKSAAESQAALFRTAQADKQALDDVNLAITQMNDPKTSHLYGPQLNAQLNRTMALMGISGGAADLQVTQKALQGNANTYLANLFGGKVGPLRSGAMEQMFLTALGKVDTDPKAGTFILQQQKYGLELKDAWRRELLARRHSDDPTERQSVDYAHSGETEATFDNDYLNSHPMPSYGGPTTATQPAKGSPGGIIRFDEQGNRIQ